MHQPNSATLPYCGSLQFWQSLDDNTCYYCNTNDRFSHFPTGTFNRLFVADSHDNLVMLNYPIKGGRKSKQKIADIEIDYSMDWQYRHVKTLQSCYGGCIFWQEYGESLRYILYKMPKFLIDFNLLFLDWINQFIDLPTIKLTSTEVSQSQNASQNGLSKKTLITSLHYKTPLDLSLLHHCIRAH